jgi:hypothetical protein
MIGEGLLRFHCKVAGDSPTVENRKDVGAAQREDVGHSDLRGNCVQMNAQALKNGACGQGGFIDKVELKLPECCGFNQDYLCLRVFEQILS